MADDSPSRHQCHCGKSFIRKEHLRRHQAGHEGKAFQCSICGRSFTRSDLLRRHGALHDASPVEVERRRERACDVCHANKTRCSGGDQCNLCAKRGLPCTYTRAAARGHSSDDDDETPTQRSPTTTTAGWSRQLQIDENMDDLDDLDDSDNTSSDFSRPEALRILHTLLTSKVSRDPKSSALVKPIPRSRITACIKSYLSTFHDRWPVLHAPTLNETTDSVVLIATMVMIESWPNGDDEMKELVTKLHEPMSRYLFEELTKVTFDPSQPWPQESLQLSVLLAAFSFETGRVKLIESARLLLSLTITSLRLYGALEAESITSEIATHYPGNFSPWVYGHRERWKRLASCALKVDAYLSLLYNQPPNLRRQELRFGLPSTYSLWHCYQLSFHFTRDRSEPWDRDSHRVSQLDITQPANVPSGILPDDVQLCLLGLWDGAWSLKGSLGVDTDSNAVGYLSQRLHLCVEQLEHMASELHKPFEAGAYTAFLLTSYMGRETTSSPAWQASVRERVNTLISSSMALAHLLMIHTHADIAKLKVICTSPIPMQMGQTTETQQWQGQILSLQTWAASAHGRAAIIAALQTWVTYEPVIGSTAKTNCVDPVIYMALAAATTVLWAWTTMDLGVCICGTGLQMAAANVESYTRPEARHWIQAGGPLSFHNRPLCKCNISARLVTWAEALDNATTSWEVAAGDTNRFRAIWAAS